MWLYSSHTCFSLLSLVLNTLSGATFHRNQRETRPARASVSSCWIGNLAHAAPHEKPLAVATSLIDPCDPGGRGAVFSRRSLLMGFKQASSHYCGSPAASSSIPHRVGGYFMVALTKLLYEPHGIFADIAGQSDKRIKQEHFLRAKRFSILGSHLFNQLAPGLIT